MKRQVFLAISTAFLFLSGCGGNQTPQTETLEDAQKVAYTLLGGADSSGTTAAVSYTLYEDEETSPFVIDQEGNFAAGGLMKYINENGDIVIIEAIAANTLEYKVDINRDGLYEADEIVVKTFEGGIYNHTAHTQSSEATQQLPQSEIDKLYSPDLKAILDAKIGDANYIGENEKIEIDMMLRYEEIGNEYASYSVSAKTNADGTITYYYNDNEITYEQMLAIQEKLDNENAAYAANAEQNKRDALNAFIALNHLEINDSMQYALDQGINSFTMQLTKSEIKTLVENNSFTILYVDRTTQIAPL